MQDSDEEDELETINKKPYVPEEFADFSVYNASLESREWLSSKGDLVNYRTLEKEASRSPTTSSITSGYFSHSASNATLSDMLVSYSDSTDHLANQIRDLDSSDHSAVHLSHDLRYSNKEALEPEGGCSQSKGAGSPLKGNDALAREIPEPEGTMNIATTKLQCSAEDFSDNKNPEHGIEFTTREITVEHISNIFEDYAFTEFMGVEDGKEFECSKVPQFCSSGSFNRSKKLSVAEMNCATGFSKKNYNKDKPASQMEPIQVANQLTSGIENPMLVVEKDSCCQTFTDSFLANDFTGKNNLDSSCCEDATCEDATSEEYQNWVAVGEQVCIGNNKPGTVRYIGPVDFSTGTWVGIELHCQMGKKLSCS